MEVLIIAIFVITSAFLVYKCYEILKKTNKDTEILLSKIVILSIFIYYSLFFALVRDLISLFWNLDHTFTFDFFLGIPCYMILLYFAIFFYIKFNLSGLIYRFIASFFVSFFISSLLLWTFAKFSHEFKPFDSFKKYVLIYTEEESSDEDDNVFVKEIPKYILEKEILIGNKSLSDEYRIIKQNSKDKEITVINSEGKEEYFKYDLCFTKQYGKYRGYKPLNVCENILEKWLYGGFLYFIEVIYKSWMLILCNILLLYSDLKLNFFTKEYELSPYDKYGL